jgi:hypothetical protein
MSRPEINATYSFPVLLSESVDAPEMSGVGRSAQQSHVSLHGRYALPSVSILSSSLA